MTEAMFLREVLGDGVPAAVAKVSVWFDTIYKKGFH
jgi:hypothetical protein